MYHRFQFVSNCLQDFISFNPVWPCIFSCDATEISDDLVARIIFSWKKNSCLSIDVVNELEDFPSTFLSPLKSLVAKKARDNELWAIRLKYICSK